MDIWIIVDSKSQVFGVYTDEGEANRDYDEYKLQTIIYPPEKWHINIDRSAYKKH